MLYITDKFVENYFNISETLADFFNKETYKVSSTSLSYRQINALDTANLLATKRKSNKEWRKFSFKDLIYISLVSELKEFGLKHTQLKILHEAFYKDKSTDKKEIDKQNYVSKTVSEVALGCVFAGVEIRLCVKNDGQIGFYDPIHFILDNNFQSQIVINFSDIVNNLVKQINSDPLPMFWKLDKYFLDGVDSLTGEEEKLLQVIRDKNYSMIRIKKKDGNISIIYAEQVNETIKNSSIDDLLKVISTKDYQDISIIKRDGKVVSYKIEDTIKL